MKLTTTAEKFVVYLETLMSSIMNALEEGRAPSAEEMKHLDALALEVITSVKKDEKDAERWRSFIGEMESAIVQAEVTRGFGKDKKGRMN